MLSEPGADYTHHITTCPLLQEISDLATALPGNQKMSFLINQRSVLRGQILTKQFRMLSTCITQNFHKSPVSHEESLEDLKKKPVKFTSSKAFNLNPHTAVGIRTEDDDTPWFQGPVIGFSLACFLIYFCILR